MDTSDKTKEYFNFLVHLHGLGHKKAKEVVDKWHQECYGCKVNSEFNKWYYETYSGKIHT